MTNVLNQIDKNRFCKQNKKYFPSFCHKIKTSTNAAATQASRITKTKQNHRNFQSFLDNTKYYLQS